MEQRLTRGTEKGKLATTVPSRINRTSIELNCEAALSSIEPEEKDVFHGKNFRQEMIEWRTEAAMSAQLCR